MKGFSLSNIFCKYNKVIVLESEPKQTLIGIVDSEDTELRNRITKAFASFNECFGTADSILEFVQLEKDEFNRLLARLFADCVVSDSAGTSEISGINPKSNDIHTNEELRPEDNSPAVNLLNSLLLDAYSVHASDIHLEPLSLGGILVRFRIGGFLREHMRLSINVAGPLFLRLKLLSGMNILESRRAQDGRFSFKTDDGNHNIDIRVSVVPSVHGESAVLRLLDASTVPLDIDNLGFEKTQLTLIKEAALAANSLIIICGPTGAGKSTTLASVLVYIHDISCGSRKIISLEDPVEYELEGITQIQIDGKLDCGFDDALRRVFRQDPDVLMIGEIRDSVSASAAVRSSMSGHLVLATLHASTPAEAIIRLIDYGIEPYMLCSVLHLVVAQHLIPQEDGSRQLFSETMRITPEIEKAILERSAVNKLETLYEKAQ